MTPLSQADARTQSTRRKGALEGSNSPRLVGLEDGGASALGLISKDEPRGSF